MHSHCWSTITPSAFRTLPPAALRVCSHQQSLSIHRALVLLCLAYFTDHNVLEVHACCCMSQNFIPFYGWKICPCMARPHFVYLFICQWTHCGFYLLAVVINAAVNMDVQISVQVPAFNFGGICPDMKLLDPIVILCLIFLRSCHTIFHGAASFYMPMNNIWGFQVLHILTDTCYFLSSGFW